MVTLSRGERMQTCEGKCLKFWVVISGAAGICTMLHDGRRQISAVEGPGDVLCGPMSGPDSPVWIEALDPCQICELDFSDRAAALQKDPDFLSVMFGVIHRRLELSSRHLTTLGRLDSTERVILFLAEMTLRAGKQRPVHLPMSRDDIADYLGLNAETVSRILSRLKKMRLFTFHSPTEFDVPDMDAVLKRLPVTPLGRAENPLGRGAADKMMEKAI